MGAGLPLLRERALGLFMEVVAGGTLGAGTILGTYEGVDNRSLHLTYKEAKYHFRASDYVLADPPHQYVIDGGPQGGQVSLPGQ
jgi:hypothetical protein